MSLELETYPMYKNIEYDYVKEIPLDWKLLPNIAIFQERIERGYNSAELLSVTIGKGVIKQTEVDVKKDSSNEDKSKYKLIRVGDIAYNKMRMWQGALGCSSYQGISSPAYVILKPKININPKYFHYMFRSDFYTNYSKRFSYGIVDDQLSLRYTDFKRMYSILPPIETQNLIVSYLDKKNNEIEKLILKKKRLIELLEEKKVAIQDDCVRFGVTKNKKNKKSGIKWIGEINSDWGILPNIAIFKEVIERGFPLEELLSVTIGRGVIKQSDSEKRDASTLDKTKYLHVKKGDLVYSMRFRQGSCGYSDLEGIVSPACTVLRPRRNSDVNVKYFYYLFKTEFYKNYIERFSYGIADGQIPLRYVDFKRMYSVFPPVSEQDKIVSFLDSEFSRINRAISVAEKEVLKIEEYRKSVIADLILGRRSVSNIE